MRYTTLCIVPLLLASASTAATPPGRQLDPRIKPDRITESAPPPLPRELVQPLPAVHRIAESPGPAVPVDGAHFTRARAAIDRGLAYLRGRQLPSGAWMRKATAAPTDDPDKLEPVTVAVTALGLKAFAQAQPPGQPNDPAAERALRLVLAARDPRDPPGWASADAIANYVNSCVVMGLASVRDTLTIDGLNGAIEALRSAQWDEGEGLAVRQDWYGGAGYGRSGRPDLSNTQLMLEALHDAGVSPDDPAVQRAVAFLSRTQNLKETNSASWAQVGANDGGFVYTPANGGESMASEAAGEGRFGEKLPEGTPRSLRSYGSMTYAGFKSLLYAGLSRDDPRVRAAFDWVRRHFTFDENPGLGAQGLYYYYHAMARALTAAQQVEITPLPGGADAPAPAPVNWREAMIDAILSRQAEDGSWVNSADRWLEGEPELVTIYAVLALEECLKPTA